MWSSLSDEEKQPYQDRAAAERELVEHAVEAWKAAGGIVPELGRSAAMVGGKPGGTGGVSLSSVDMPVARVKKICKLDPEVKNLTKEGLLMVTKAAELVLVKLGKECVKTAQIQNRRKLLPDDLAQVCSVREQFLFLREDIQDLHRHMQRENIETGKQNKAAKDSLGAKVASKPITDFFKSAS
jgi:DNA-directed RNA polymerase I subunit RPA43